MDEKGAQDSMYCPVLRARPGPDGGNPRMNLSYSLLGRHSPAVETDMPTDHSKIA